MNNAAPSIPRSLRCPWGICNCDLGIATGHAEAHAGCEPDDCTCLPVEERCPAGCQVRSEEERLDILASLEAAELVDDARVVVAGVHAVNVVGWLAMNAVDAMREVA
jgi:hypothetical protein